MTSKDKKLLEKIKEVHPDDSFDDGVITDIYCNGEHILSWDDCASHNYPEDLTWHRMIANIFYTEVELGIKLARNNDK